MDPAEEIEWASRQYQVATTYLIEVLERCADDDVPVRIKRALTEMADAINKEWAQ